MKYLNNFCTTYIDNILIYSDDSFKHKLHVKKILKCLQTAELQTNIKKSKFSIILTKFLGFISTDDISINPEKVLIIRN